MAAVDRSGSSHRLHVEEYDSTAREFLASRENGDDDDKRSEGNDDPAAVPPPAFSYGEEIDFPAKVRKLERDFLAATAAIAEEQGVTGAGMVTDLIE